MESLSEYIAFIWIGFAVFMLICEALTSQLVSIWFVLGGIAAAISCIFTDNILIQSIIFVAVSFISLVATRPLVKRFTKNKIQHTNADGLVGRMALVTIDIVNSQGQGQVNVDGKIWSARSADGKEIMSGANVKITAIQGVKLVVEIV